jgi:hypothetical protein
VPGCPSSGIGQNSPCSASIRSHVAPSVVGGAAGGREAELFEDLVVSVREVLALPSRSAMSTRICQSSRASPGGVTAALILMIRPSPAGGGALVLLVERAGQHDVGVMAGLGEEEVDDA